MKKLLIAALLLSPVANAEMFEAADEAIEYRQAVFQLIRYNVGAVGDMVKGKSDWNQQEIARRADNLAQLASMPMEAFRFKGSDKGETSAKAAIWNDWDKFSAKMDKFSKAAGAFGDLPADASKGDVKKAFMATVKNCKSCHDDFKSKG